MKYCCCCCFNLYLTVLFGVTLIKKLQSFKTLMKKIMWLQRTRCGRLICFDILSIKTCVKFCSCHHCLPIYHTERGFEEKDNDCPIVLKCVVLDSRTRQHNPFSSFCGEILWISSSANKYCCTSLFLSSEKSLDFLNLGEFKHHRGKFQNTFFLFAFETNFWYHNYYYLFFNLQSVSFFIFILEVKRYDWKY